MLKLSCVFLLVNVYINCRISRVSAAAANATLDVRSVSFWRSLSSKLHIFDKTFCEAQGTFATDVVDASMVRNLVWNEGYAQLEPLEWGLPLGDMVEIIEELHQRNIPITFCFMYDEFWFMFMRLHHTLGHVLGPEYKRLPDFWAWRVDPKHSERGWKVHRDKNYETLYRNGLPKSLSVWIPLTDATTSNGCMYVLPADRDPTYRKMQAIGQHWEDIAPDIRALPVQAGWLLMLASLIKTVIISYQICIILL